MEGVKQQPRWRSDQSLERGVYLCVCVCVVGMYRLSVFLVLLQKKENTYCFQTVCLDTFSWLACSFHAVCSAVFTNYFRFETHQKESQVTGKSMVSPST